MTDKDALKKIVFFDRDGVINIDNGYVSSVDRFEFTKGIFKLCIHLKCLGYELAIVTNQSGIGRGLYSEKDFILLNSWMLSKLRGKLINILDVFFCPHHPDDHCICRKPAPGMFQDAIEKYNIEIGKSSMIGDKESDIIAAESIGIKNSIIFNKKISDSSAKHCVSSLEDIINIIKV